MFVFLRIRWRESGKLLYHARSWSIGPTSESNGTLKRFRSRLEPIIRSVTPSPCWCQISSTSFLGRTSCISWKDFMECNLMEFWDLFVVLRNLVHLKFHVYIFLFWDFPLKNLIDAILSSSLKGWKSYWLDNTCHGSFPQWKTHTQWR